MDDHLKQIIEQMKNAPTTPLRCTGSGRGLPNLSMREPVRRPKGRSAWVRARIWIALPFLLFSVILLPEEARQRVFKPEAW